MVYGGRHSKACERCRARRLKCDLSRPTCRNCEHAGVACPGYRNEQDLLFKDETALLIAKLNAKAASSAKANISDRSHKCPGSKEQVPNRAVEDEAIRYLLDYYLHRSSFHYVGEMYRATKSDSLFHQTVRATALAAYSYEIDETKLLDQARHIYGNALMQLKDALVAPNIADDEVLATVLLMSRFETLSKNTDEHTLSKTWSNHVNGAFDLLNENRAEGSFPDQYSLHLVEQTVHNYNVYCLNQLQRRPDTLLDLSKQLAIRSVAASNHPSSNMRLKFHVFTDAFSGYLACRRSYAKDDSIELIEWGWGLDEQCLAFMDELAKTSKYEVINTSDPDVHLDEDLVLHGNTYHIYPDHFEARLWNSVRMMRLSINECIYVNARTLRDSTAGEDDPKYSEYYAFMERSWKSTLATVADICASAPQFLRHKSHPDCTPVAGCFLAWPLYIAAKLAQKQCADFVAERLEWIGRELKIQAATIAAEDLKYDEYRDDWLTACYLF